VVAKTNGGLKANADDLEIDFSNLLADAEAIDAPNDKIAWYNASTGGTGTKTWATMITDLEGEFLRLDCSNDPLTGTLHLGPDDSSTKSLVFEHTGAGGDGTITCDANGFDIDRPVEITVLSTQLALSYTAGKSTYIQTQSNSHTRFSNLGSDIFRFGGTSNVSDNLTGITIENGGLIINRQSGSPYMMWKEADTGIFQLRTDLSSYIRVTDGGSSQNLLKIRYNTARVAGEAAMDLQDQPQTSREGLRIRKGLNSTWKHILFSYNNGSSYTHAISTNHNSGGTASNTINFHLWDNTIGGNTVIPGANQQHLTIAHDELIIGPADTDTKTLTFNNSGGDGTITYDGSTLLLDKPTEFSNHLIFNEITAPGTPASNKANVYLDSTVEELVVKKDTGDVHNLERSLVCLSAYVDIKARNKVFNVNGNFENLVTAGAVSSGSPQAATAGIGKLVIVVNAGTDTAGTLTVTGTKVDRDDGTETGAFADNLTVAGTSTDTTTTDAAGNTVWGFSNAYITSVWFTGVVSISTTDLNLSDIDVYQVAFEQFNDEPDTVVETADITAYANNAAAWYYAHGYKLSVSGDTCTIAETLTISWPASKVTANTPYRWRRVANTAVDGSTDGIWGEHFFGPLANTYWEDINIKLWASLPKKE
jgi:hypothetical protein